MLQDEDYGSDSSDDDYIPTEGKDSDDDVSSGAEGPNSDIGGDSNDEVESSSKKKKVKKTNKNNKSKSRSKANPLLLQLQQDNVDEPLPSEVEDPQNQSEQEKKKDDDIWADFLADTEEKKVPVVVKPKKLSWSELLGNKNKKNNVASTLSLTQVDATPTTVAPSNVSSLSSVKKLDIEKPTTVKITKIFDFAGEEVRVEEEVAADSKEAQSAAAQERLAQSSPLLGAAVKRSSNLAGLVNSLAGKKQKLSTLEKTKLDWQSYKKEEGLTDELLLHTKSKDTYLDKQEFLQRADVRQFELEREVRLGGRRSLK